MIVLSLVGFVFTLYPIVALYLFPGKPITLNEIKREQGFYLAIPKIRAQSIIIANVDPWNETSYQQALKNGVAHAKGFAFPGEKGTVFLFAHSSGTPWELTYTNTPFLRLGELQTGDEIYVKRNGKLFTYKVSSKKEVWPNEVSYLQNKDNILILQTCTPIGTSLKRLLVFAKEQ